MDGIKLNLGAGHMNVGDGYVNIDAHPYTPDTVVCRFPPLPYENATVEAIFAGHLMEHVPPWDVLPLLEECRRVLIPGGTLTLICPDAPKARLLLESKRLVVEWFARIVCGDTHDDMPHWILFSRERMGVALEKAGFTLDLTYDWRTDARVFDTKAIWQSGARGVKP